MKISFQTAVVINAATGMFVWESGMLNLFLDVFLNFFMLKLVILFHVEMARNYILDLATLKSKAKRHALSVKKAIYLMLYFGCIIT
jgi:hypothetical protein